MCVQLRISITSFKWTLRLQLLIMYYKIMEQVLVLMVFSQHLKNMLIEWIYVSISVSHCSKQVMYLGSKETVGLCLLGISCKRNVKGYLLTRLWWPPTFCYIIRILRFVKKSLFQFISGQPKELHYYDNERACWHDLKFANLIRAKNSKLHQSQPCFDWKLHSHDWHYSTSSEPCYSTCAIQCLGLSFSLKRSIKKAKKKITDLGFQHCSSPYCDYTCSFALLSPQYTTSIISQSLSIGCHFPAKDTTAFIPCYIW